MPVTHTINTKLHSQPCY